MRDSRQISSTVKEYHDWQRAERKRHLAAVLAMLRRAREREDEWYTWILELRRRRLAGVTPVVPPSDGEERLL